MLRAESTSYPVSHPIEGQLPHRSFGAGPITASNAAQAVEALPAPWRKRPNLILEAAGTAIAPTTTRYRKASRDQDVG